MAIILSKPFARYGTINTPTDERMVLTSVDVFNNIVKIKAYRQIWEETWSTEREMKYTDVLKKFESGEFFYLE
jgi:hypothetical protein